MEYFVHLMILICIYLILAQSFNVSFGLGLLFNLAHIAAYAIGAYTTALLSTEVQAGFFVCVAASMLLSGLFAILLGGIALKLEQEYFAIGTLAFSSVVTALLINWKELTNGVLGIPGIPRPESKWLLDVAEYIVGAGKTDMGFYENSYFLVLIAAFVVIVQAMLYILFRNSYARTLRAQAEFDAAASSLAKDTRLARNLSFFVASSFAGLAGSFFAYYINYIDPTSFSLHEMIFVLTIVVVGKPGSFWGVIGGTFFLVLLPEPLRFTAEFEDLISWLFSMPLQQVFDIFLIGPILNGMVEVMRFVSQPSILGPARQFLYALILFLVVYWRREQLFPVERTV